MPELTIANCDQTLEINSDEIILRQCVRNRVPIRHNCRGRARCATCQIRVLDGIDNLSDKNEFELFILRLREITSPDIRLACQTRASGDATVEFVNELTEEERPWTNDPAYQLAFWPEEEIGHPQMKEGTKI